MISFHLASNCESPIIKNNKFYSNGKSFSFEDMISSSKDNNAIIRNIFPHCKIAVENNNYLNTSAYDTITDGNFISDIVYSNNLFFLLDIAHAKISAKNKKINYQTYLKSLPLDKIIQLHISQHTIENNIAYDSHVDPSNETLNELPFYFNLSPHCKYVTLEYYQDSRRLLHYIKKIKDIINKCYDL